MLELFFALVLTFGIEKSQLFSVMVNVKLGVRDMALIHVCKWMYMYMYTCAFECLCARCNARSVSGMFAYTGILLPLSP